jgi:hypothetical protein
MHSISSSTSSKHLRPAALTESLTNVSTALGLTAPSNLDSLDQTAAGCAGAANGTTLTKANVPPLKHHRFQAQPGRHTPGFPPKQIKSTVPTSKHSGARLWGRGGVPEPESNQVPQSSPYRAPSYAVSFAQPTPPDDYWLNTRPPRYPPPASVRSAAPGPVGARPCTHPILTHLTPASQVWGIQGFKTLIT